MATFSRTDQSVLGRWWWTVDRWTLFCIVTLIGFGYVLVLAASPAVAERIHQSRDVFILKQVFFLALAGVVLVGVSLLSPRNIRRVALAGCVFAILLTALTLVHGVELDRVARSFIAAQRVLKTVFCGRHRLAADRRPFHPRFPGHDPGVHRVRHYPDAAEIAA
jgi:cell division protein FtsW